MDPLKQKIDIEIKVTPVNVAELFCSMDAKEQADFFNEVYNIAQTWPSCNFDLQMCYAWEAENLTNGGRKIMAIIGIMSQTSN